MKIVQKYGGSSLADAVCVRRVAERIRTDAEKNQILVVVSAQGKTTDGLTKQYEELAEFRPGRESDALLCTGEQVSAALLAIALNDIGVNAISLNGAQVPIWVSGQHGDGQITKIDTERIYREWNKGNVIIVTGFQGVRNNGDFMTLGRGGSDTSAVALAAAVRADKCMIFTDVDGIYSADPNRIPEAVRFDSVHEDTVIDLAVNGAKVLHPKAAALIKKHKVPTEILTSFSRRDGTVISDSAPKRIGITSRITTGGTVMVTVVFPEKPDKITIEKIRKTLPFSGTFLENLWQISLPCEECDSAMKTIHSVFYPN